MSERDELEALAALGESIERGQRVMLAMLEAIGQAFWGDEDAARAAAQRRAEAA